MKRRRFSHLVPPPVTLVRGEVADVTKRRHLSRAERRALKEKQLFVFEGQGEGK